MVLQFQLNQDKMNFSTLRNIQGLHAPLKLQMEYRAARQVTAHLSLIVSVPLVPLLLFRFNHVYSSCPDVCASSLQIQRLPFLQSSNLALDTLRGSDECIGFEDILNGESLNLFTPSVIVVSCLCMKSDPCPVFVLVTFQIQLRVR